MIVQSNDNFAIHSNSHGSYGFNKFKFYCNLPKSILSVVVGNNYCRVVK